jgi:hypothetical protein
MAKKEQWEIDRENRIKAEKASMNALTPSQREAIKKAHNALRDFVNEWSDGFDLYNAETPRNISTAFWQMHHHFHLDDDDV